MNSTYEIPESISSETIENETIVVNLEKGTYYSLEDNASLIWTWMEKGASFENLNNTFQGVEKFLNELISEELISPKEKTFSLDINSLPKPISSTPPKMAKFSDMQDLLLLDPIHETSDMGWPHKMSEQT